MLTVGDLEIKKGKDLVKDAVQPEKGMGVGGKGGVEKSQRALEGEDYSA